MEKRQKYRYYYLWLVSHSLWTMFISSSSLGNSEGDSLTFGPQPGRFTAPFPIYKYEILGASIYLTSCMGFVIESFSYSPFELGARRQRHGQEQRC